MEWSLSLLLLVTSSARAYWCNNTDVPIPASFVRLGTVDDTVLEEMRYANDWNFVGTPICGYRAPVCFLTRTAAHALRAVQRAARTHNATLKVYDCYRPQRASDFFVEWARNTTDVRMQPVFYPAVPKQDLFRDGFIASHSAHSRGSTVDLTLVPLPVALEPPLRVGTTPMRACTLPWAQRVPDDSLDMGTGFDCFSALAYTNATGIAPEARRNRALLQRLMRDAGFINLPEEWWHFTLANEPFPNTAFDFVVQW